jgi:hypothetical protein
MQAKMVTTWPPRPDHPNSKLGQFFHSAQYSLGLVPFFLEAHGIAIWLS